MLPSTATYSLTFWIESIACLPLAALAWHDWSTRRLPNRLIALLAGLAMIKAYASAVDLHWSAAFLVLIAGMLLVAINICGAGDVKLLTACILLISDQISAFLLVLALCGGCLSLMYGILRCYRYYRRSTDTVTHVPGVPYGVAIAFVTAMKIANPYLIFG